MLGFQVCPTILDLVVSDMRTERIQTETMCKRAYLLYWVEQQQQKTFKTHMYLKPWDVKLPRNRVFTEGTSEVTCDRVDHTSYMIGAIRARGIEQRHTGQVTL